MEHLTTVSSLELLYAYDLILFVYGFDNYRQSPCAMVKNEPDMVCRKEFSGN